MYALLVTADVEPGHEEEGLEYLRAMLPDLQQIPGLLSGHWLATTTDGESLAVVMFEDEAAAKQMAEIGLPNAPQPPGAKFAAPKCGRLWLRSERPLGTLDEGTPPATAQ